MALLTSRTLATGVTGTDLIHIVITGDTSQNPAGSSYKAEIDQVKDYLSTFFVNSTGNTSGNCITDLYVDNLYGCSPITIHDSLQNISGTSSGVTSHSFGYQTIALGDYSHSEGSRTNTGFYGYNSTSIVLGVITLDASYGDVTSEFSSKIILDDLTFGNTYGVSIFDVSSVTFGTNTVITLQDLSVSTTQAHIGSLVNNNPLNSDVGVGGHYSHSEGDQTISLGQFSHSEGVLTQSIGNYSHSEGINNKSTGDYSHSEGFSTESVGRYSHSEGFGTQTLGEYSHAEGNSTQSLGQYSHSEGDGTSAFGDVSHAEGKDSVSFGSYSHAEGFNSRSTGEYSHSEGIDTDSVGNGSHVEGHSSKSLGQYSHSEGYDTYAGQYGYNSTSIVSGVITLDASYGDVTSEFSTAIILDDSNFINTYGVEYFTISSVVYTTNTEITLNDLTVNTAQAYIGTFNNKNPLNSNAVVGGYSSHSEGENNVATGKRSHSQGYRNKSIGLQSFSSGQNSSAIGINSFVHSTNSTVYGDRSVILGGNGLVGNDDDTVYVPYLNINSLNTGTSINNLGIDAQGNVVVGTTGDTNVFVTGATYNDANTFTFTNNTGGTFDVSFDTVTGLTATTLTVTDLSGTGDRIVTATPQGSLSASNQTIIQTYIDPVGTVAGYLDNTSNWDINGDYTGTTITATYQGQKHYNSNYFFEAVDDNLWKRLIRG
jgi:hypothetical protein